MYVYRFMFTYQLSHIITSLIRMKEQVKFLSINQIVYFWNVLYLALNRYIHTVYNLKTN